MKLNIEKLKREIERRQWSMADFADAMKAKRTLPYHIFNNPDSLTFKTIQKIADALEYDPKDLII